MKIISRNVNGIRAVAKKGFLDFFQKQDADLYCLQETKAFKEQLPVELQNPFDYKSVWHKGTRPGYAGTAIFSRLNFENGKNHFEEVEHFNDDGRVVETSFGNLVVLNVYFPNGQTRADGTEMLNYKLEFHEKMLDYGKKLVGEGKSVVITGDFNVAHTEIDIARPKENKDSIGFLPIERERISDYLRAGFVDAFRHFHPEEKDRYTWWSYRAGARPRNVGWRLDYFMVSPNLVDKVKKVEQLDQIFGSDHCPILLELDL